MRKLSIIILFFFTTVAFAQKNITGTITEQGSNASLPAATIIIADVDKNIIVSAETDGNGYYSINLPALFKEGTITITYLGFTPFEQKLSAGNLPERIDVSLIPQPEELQGVVIESRRKAITMKGDKIIFNVGGLGIGNGNNGLETIRLLPGMRLDKDENLIYRGGSNFQVFINGKKSLLTGDALREYIRSLKGSDIESVEIIAQPSARYEASGTAGIINIVLKKNRNAGMNGNIYTAAAYGEYFKNWHGGRLYYNDSLWAVNANGSYYNGRSVNHRRVKQNIILGEDEKIIDQYNDWLPYTKSASFTVAVERKLNEKQAISTEWNYYNSYGKETTYGKTTEYLNDNLQDIVNLTQRETIPESRITGNVFYNFTADSSATKLDIQANFARYEIKKDGFQSNEYLDATTVTLQSDNRTRYIVVNGQADFTQRLSNIINMETGVKYSYVKMDYYNLYEANGSRGIFIPDSLLINDFAFDEKLASAYTQFSGDFGKWNVQAGLRAEHYKYVAASKINLITNKGNYTNFFPSFSVNYKNEDHQYQLSYSRRIGRPNYLSLNPYYEYTDAYTLKKGNPTLKPQFYHSFQLNYIYKNAFNFSLYGYLYKNGFTKVIDYQQEQNYNITYNANAATGNRFGFSATLPYEPVKWWTMQLSVDSYYNSEKSDIERFAYSGEGFGYDISLYESVELKGDWKFTLNGFYSGRATTPNGYSKATYDFSISAKKDLLDKRLRLSGGCSNILKKSFYNHTTQVNNVSTDWTNRWETRRFYLQATWYFGTGKSKEIKAASLQEETQRI